MNQVKRPIIGVALMLGAMAVLPGIDVIAKLLGQQGMPILQVVWARLALGALMTLPFALRIAGPKALWPDRPWYHTLRAAFLVAATFFFFLSLKWLPIADALAIFFVQPLILTAISPFMLGEKVGPRRWAAVAVGFVGTLIIIRPGSQHLDWTVLLPLMLVGTNSGFQLLTSKMAKTEDPITTHFYTGWIGTAMASLLLPFVWEMPADWTVWLQLLLMGVLASIGHFLLILAYGRTPAATLTPYLYTQIGFAVLGGWVVFDHLPDQWTFAGMALVALCGALGAWLTVRENRIAIQPPES